MSNVKSFTLKSFVPAGYAPVLSSIEIVQGDDGKMYKADGAKWTKVTDLENRTGKYDNYFMNPLAEEDRGTQDTYLIFATKPEGRTNGGRSPVATLKVSRAGAPIDETTGKPVLEDVCTLFLHTYDDGSSKLQGQAKGSMIRYGVFLNEIKQVATPIAVNG